MTLTAVGPLRVNTGALAHRGPTAAPWAVERTTRILFPHGFGDVIQALPSFRRLALKTGRRLEIGALRRLPACHELLDRQVWCARTFSVADVWNDFPPVNTWEGYRRGWDALCREHPDALPVFTRSPEPGLRTVAKAVRIAAELGVPFVDENPIPDPEAIGDGYQSTKAWLYLAGQRRLQGVRSIAVIHGSAGNRSKDVSRERLEGIAKRALAEAGFLRPYGYVHVPISDIRGGTRPETVRFHRDVIAKADLFVGVDSGPAHLASTTATRCVWVFTATPVEQAIPLYARPGLSALVLGPCRDGLLARWRGWCSANPDLVPGGLVVEDGGAL